MNKKKYIKQLELENKNLIEVNNQLKNNKTFLIRFLKYCIGRELKNISLTDNVHEVDICQEKIIFIEYLLEKFEFLQDNDKV